MGKKDTMKAAKVPLVEIAQWSDDAGADYSVNVDDGWINVSQSQNGGQDVLGGLDPATALRLVAALVKAARLSESHPRWK